MDVFYIYLLCVPYFVSVINVRLRIYNNVYFIVNIWLPDGDTVSCIFLPRTSVATILTECAVLTRTMHFAAALFMFGAEVQEAEVTEGE